MAKSYARLKSRAVIQSLFDKGSRDVSRISSGCISLVYKEERDEAFFSVHQLHLGFAVSRSIRRAVDRNRIKRIMRESIRIHSDAIIEASPSGLSIVMMLVYRASTLDKDIQKDLANACRKLEERLSVNNT